MTAQVITRQDERWDTLSQRVFGRPDAYPLLFDANPLATLSLRYAATLPAGIALSIPLDVEPSAIQAEAPPWRR